MRLMEHLGSGTLEVQDQQEDQDETKRSMKTYVKGFDAQVKDM